MRQYGKQGSPARNAPHFLLFCCFRGLDKLEYVPFSRFIHPSCRRPSFCKVPTTFRQFCKRNPDVSSEMPSPPQILLQAADRNFHNSFCLTSQIQTTMEAFNHADAQRHLQDVSEVSFLTRLHPCRFGTAPNRRRYDKVKTSLASMEANRAPPFGGRCVLWLCRLEAIFPSIRCYAIEHRGSVARPRRRWIRCEVVFVAFPIAQLLTSNCLLYLSALTHHPPADHSRRPQRYIPTNNCNHLWHGIHKKQHHNRTDIYRPSPVSPPVLTPSSFCLR